MLVFRQLGDLTEERDEKSYKEEANILLMEVGGRFLYP